MIWTNEYLPIEILFRFTEDLSTSLVTLFKSKEEKLKHDKQAQKIQTEKLNENNGINPPKDNNKVKIDEDSAIATASDTDSGTISAVNNKTMDKKCGKPPKIPPNMRQTKPLKEEVCTKGDSKEGAVVLVEKVGRFPRESVYDNVAETADSSAVLAVPGDVTDGANDCVAAVIADTEGEDEGIDNYYSDDSGSSPKVRSL